ncbi:hypothetical protein GW931_01405 [archaeon]|nr:hypothetical protein [archaeon]
MSLDNHCDSSCLGLDSFVDNFPTTNQINKELDFLLKDTFYEKIENYSNNIYSFFY